MRIIVLEGPGRECDGMAGELVGRGYKECECPTVPAFTHLLGAANVPPLGRTGTVFVHLYLRQYRAGELGLATRSSIEQTFTTEPGVQLVLCLPPWQAAVERWLEDGSGAPLRSYEAFKAEYNFYAHNVGSLWRAALVYDRTRYAQARFAHALEVM